MISKGFQLARTGSKLAYDSRLAIVIIGNSMVTQFGKVSDAKDRFYRSG